jgi:hypothetical protein
LSSLSGGPILAGRMGGLVLMGAPEGALEDRVGRTLEIMASRGYNPTVERLSRMLVGGPVEGDALGHALGSMPGVNIEDGFVYLDGMRYVDRCRVRVEANGRFQDAYRRIAEDYTADLVGLCPWVRCVMLVGSVATGGLCQGDDLDLNVVVDDGRKYTTLAMSTLLNRRYALRHGIEIGFEPTPPYRLPMFMCLNIIWEDREAHPFRRQDAQMAYELASADVLHGHDYFEGMLRSNRWVMDHFPQIGNGHSASGGRARARRGAPRGVRPEGLVERVLRGAMFSYDRVVRIYLSGRPDVIDQVDHYERLKHPYGLYDLPSSGDDGG